MKKLKITIYLILLLTAPLFAQEKWQNIVAEHENLIDLFPEKEELEFEVKEKGKHLGNRKEITTYNKEKEELTVHIFSEVLDSVIVYDKKLRVLSEKLEYFNEDSIRDKGFTKKIISYDEKSKMLLVSVYNKAGLKDEKKLYYDDNLIPSDALLPIMRAVLLKDIKKSFYADITLDYGFTVGIDFILSTKNTYKEAVEEKYIPDEFEKNKIDLGEYYFFEAGLNGFLAFFIGEKQYFSFKKNSTYEYAAYWRGPHDDSSYYLIKEPATIVKKD